MRKLFITDIHGQYTKTMDLLKSVNYTDDDLLIIGGDYFDRGPENDLVADWLCEIYKKPNVILLKGNHDLYLKKFLDYENHKGISDYLEIQHMITVNGGAETLFQLYRAATGKELKHESFQEIAIEVNKRFPELLSVLGSLKWYYETDTEVFTHGYLPGSYKEATNFDWETAVWENSAKEAEFGYFHPSKPVYIGHFMTPLLAERLGYEWDGETPIVINDVHFCDGGLAANLKGMIVVLEDKKF